MVHGYHVIWGTYGFWLPNDPRGSWSEFVASWELAKFGLTTRSPERRDLERKQWEAWRSAAGAALKFPAVHLNGLQARAVGTGFGAGVRKSGFTIWACSILPQHIHMVIARHKYKVEQICNLLKGEATKQLKSAALHPQAQYQAEDGKFPSMWGEKQWKVFLEDDRAIETAIRYVAENPIKEHKAAQDWSFVTPFTRISKSAWTTYH